MSEQSLPSDETAAKDNPSITPSQDLDPISPESFNSDSNQGKEATENTINTNEVTAEKPTNGDDTPETHAVAATPMDVDESSVKEISFDDAGMGEGESKTEESTSNEPEKEHVDQENVSQNMTSADDSVMEQDPEQVNCSAMEDNSKTTKSIADDPFDALSASESNISTAVEPPSADDNNSSVDENADDSTVVTDVTHDEHIDTASNTDVTDNGDAADITDVENADTENTDAENADAENADTENADAENADAENADATTNGDQREEATSEATSEAVDDIEEGKGVDEELELLPDAECELSEADKERAILAKEAAEQEIDEHAAETVDAADENEDEIGDKVNESRADDIGTVADETASELQRSLNEDEIRELNEDEWIEKTCIACKTDRICRYALLSKAVGDDAPTHTLQYLCELECVSDYRVVHTSYSLTARKVSINLIVDTPEKCQHCNENRACKYRIVNESGLVTFVCSDDCVAALVQSNPEKYVVKKKRYLIEELTALTEEQQPCLQCGEVKKCKYTFKHDNDDMYVCENSCVNLLMTEQSDRFRTRRQSVRVRDLPKRIPAERPVDDTEIEATASPGGERDKIVTRTEEESKQAQIDREASFIRRCAQCFSEINTASRILQWETMDYCNETCLGQYQTSIGAACTTCQNAVSLASLGKYCVRFGFHVRQFCTSACLGVYKKDLKVCSYCQKDISKKSGFLAPIAGVFKDFCDKACMQRYEQICAPKKKLPNCVCAVCNNNGQVKIEVFIDSHTHNICSKPCLSAFQFVNNIFPDSCTMCKKYFERKSVDSHTIYEDKQAHLFCSKICMNIYIITNRKIAPCSWCKVKKYNFDMIQNGRDQNLVVCSLNCLKMCEVSMDALSQKQQPCDKCGTMTISQYHLTMSDASVRNFCTYQCVMAFQSQFSRKPLTLGDEETSRPVPTGLPKRIKPGQEVMKSVSTQPQKTLAGRGRPPKQQAVAAKNAPKATNNLVITNVTSLAPPTRSGRRGPPPLASLEKGALQPVVELEPLPPLLLQKSSAQSTGTSTRVENKTQVVVVPPLPKKISNASTMCRPATASKEITAKPRQTSVGCQTDSFLEIRMVVPIPVPIYMPAPMHMYSLPAPVPVPIPLPIPVPIFIPTTRNSANGIMKEIKKIQDKMPVDPFEAELLMMAEMVAGDKKKEDTDSDTDEDGDDFGGENIAENNFGEDMLQMALKMATEYDEPAVDLESAMTASTITPNSHPALHGSMPHQHLLLLQEQQRQQPIPATTGRKRGPPARNTRGPAAKRGRKAQEEPIPVPEPVREPVEKADANMCLKFTFGVNAWKQWVMTKNADLEKSTLRRKPFKSELLQMTADELNYSLCLFVKEVRKPNGSEYAPDTIYYLVLGIQQYLYENGRIDNIFTDPYYERFTDCLDEVAKKFSVLYNDSQYIVTRVEEEHLWECKQLGAHSPHVLLSTLMFFNTKHFNLTSVDEHMQLSFSHIMKHWKRNPNQGSAKVPGSRNVLLRFYPPQNTQDSSGRKKKVYEQQENEDNPLRCPVKLYEFYLSKCPESVKTRNDVFYLLPERSCVPDSPVWYSTQALGKAALSKMLHRVKMVKEINIALLTS